MAPARDGRMTAGPKIVSDGLTHALAPGFARRGACPTLREPMRTGDGLLARIRVSGACLTPSQLSDLAHLAAGHGNGVVEVTARGNLQVRGLNAVSTAPFAEAVEALMPTEQGIVIDVSPLSGCDPHEIADARPLAQAIQDGARAMSERLGPKVSIVVDGGGQIDLASIKADIRLVALPGRQWSVRMGGGRPQIMDGEGAVAAALATLGALAAIGPEARATDLFPDQAERAPTAGRLEPAVRFGPLSLTIGHTSPIALPFGSARSSLLVELCQAASAADVGSIRLAPGHALLLDKAPASLIAHADSLGFITQSDDPRRRVSGCIGSFSRRRKAPAIAALASGLVSAMV